MKKIHRKLLGIILFLLFIIYWKHVSYSGKKYQKHFPNINFSSIITPHEHLKKGNFDKFRKIKTILLYTTHFYSEVWKGLSQSSLNGYTKKAQCSISECIVTYDKDAITTADVVVFHGVDFTYKNYTAKHFQVLARKKPFYQRWVFWMHETPLYYPLLDNYDNLFNWTMTFSQSSDLYHPYYSYTRLKNDDEIPRKYVNYAIRKTKKISWMVSHCGMTRASYVTELQKYTDVTVYGLCGADFNNMGGICSYVETECVEELSKYKFYLSFENSFCEDYVTEKYYKFGLMYGLVPIVMGAKYDHMNAIPGSYIDVTKFSSIKELGEYINYLDSHDDEYNRYFEWKKHFKVTEGINKICTLCHAAHNKDNLEKYHKLFHSFWSVHNLCTPFEKVRSQLEHQIAASEKESKIQ